MNFQQLRDLVAWSANYHSSLADQYLSLAADLPKPRVWRIWIPPSICWIAWTQTQSLRQPKRRRMTTTR